MKMGRKYSIRKIEKRRKNNSDHQNIINDINLKYSRDDKFLGTFREGKVILQREYLSHSDDLSIYTTKVFHRSKAPVAQIIFVHGWASSSNFLEVSSLFDKK